MTEAMPFLQKYDITFLRPLPIWRGGFFPCTFLYTNPGRERGRCWDGCVLRPAI